MKALIIIDMQKVSFTPKTPRHDTKGVVERLNELSGKFRQRGDLVIFCQHNGSRQGFCFPNTEEWEILSELTVYPNDLIVSKIANDAFYKTVLDEKLIESGITEIVITGCASDFCVDATVKSALNKEYCITVISDCHTTADRQNIPAENVIDYYNWIWSNLMPTKEKIRVIDFKEYINTLD